MHDLRAAKEHVSVTELLVATASERPGQPVAARVVVSDDYDVTSERVDAWLDRGQITSASVAFSRDNAAAPLSLISSDFEVQGRTWPFLLSSDKVRRLVNDGYTMVISGPEIWDEALRRSALDVVGAMVASLNTMIFLTPPGSSGFHQHRDPDDHVVVVQTEGSKTWRLYDAAPDGWTEDDPTRPEPESLSAEVNLDVGDTLVIPRGWGHAACTGPAALSTHLSFGINYVSPAHMLRTALIGRLRQMRESATLEETETAYRALVDEFERCDVGDLVREYVSAPYRTGELRLGDIAVRRSRQM
ncbi:JmjC domain-containing protein [Actinomadura macra]|uniref:JmjC domain-containing protein n=1 Tax=Actinomadura macra TaxID=46164 RepID=UPI00082B813B|nr:cupin domain-containing protein [Actinomadura macra]